MKIGVVMPMYINNWNHLDFTTKTTESIKTSHEWMFIPVYNFISPQFLPYVWHFTQHPKEIHVVEGRQPQAVAKAWNDGIQKAIELGCEYILVINNDIVLKSNAIDNLVAFAENHKEAVLWSMGGHNDLFTIEQAVDNPADFHEHPNFSSFMVHKTWPQEFGLFDENFIPAYHEDSCTHARLAQAHKKAYVTGGAWFFHFGSRTINSDPDFRETMPPMFVKGATYFRQKWGTGVLSEVDQMREQYYKHPYNIEELGLNEWIPDFWEFLSKNNIESISDVPKQIVLDYLKERGLR